MIYGDYSDTGKFFPIGNSISYNNWISIQQGHTNITIWVDLTLPVNIKMLMMTQMIMHSVPPQEAT